MKKKGLAVLLAATMAVSMASAGMTALAEGDTVRVGMVTDVGGVNDGSFNQSSWEGLSRAMEELGIEAKYLESATDADYATNIETFIDDEYDLIICVGYMLADATRQAAEDYPEQKFAIIDDATCADLENVTCLMFEQAQASYLVGYVAGLTTESNTVGFALGMSTEVMNQFGYGYVAGVLDANPEAKVLQQNINAFGDPATGKSMATAMITDGADVIFHAAGASGLGVIEACKENGIWAIGVDSDQSSIAPETILTSAMKRVDNACYDVAQSVIEGTLEAGIHTYDLTSAGVDIAPTTDNLSDDVLEAVEQVKEQIMNGDITVPTTKEAFEAAYGDVYELD
ncbi:MAG: BMP family ABC transporter substrate-binding protein [Lachnospiraceae bacterium]|nr:BMP family ABC transporter substrate-binding protein [Lachnospiraceae bacterium]